MLSPEIERVMKEIGKQTEMLEYFDRTGKLPLRKIRRSFTITNYNFDKLKKTSKETGKSMSDILDELIDREIRLSGTGK